MTDIAVAKQAAVDMLLQESRDCDSRMTRENLTFSVSYLSFFGYVATGLLQSLADQQLREAITSFQTWFGLTADGVIGPKTLKAMSLGRCGCNDIPDPDNNLHLKYMRMQETIENSKNAWKRNGLTFAIRDHIPGIPPQTQADILERAWKAWDDVCGISITKAASTDTADLIISTGRGNESKFDGRGGILAWSYLPDGRDKQLIMKFDLDEIWVTEPPQRGILLFNVACHEFGHMLGLSHSTRPHSLMAPSYNPHIAVPQSDDDIEQVRRIYGIDPVASQAKTLSIVCGSGQKFVLTCRELQIDGFDLVPKKE